MNLWLKERSNNAKFFFCGDQQLRARNKIIGLETEVHACKNKQIIRTNIKNRLRTQITKLD